MIPILLSLLAGWKQAFVQERTAWRAIAQALAMVSVVGRRTIARSIAVRGAADRSWAAEYKLHSRGVWDERALFVPMLHHALALCPGDLVAVGGDDTRLPKTGRKISAAAWGRDPLSPRFRHNLAWGLRFLHAAILVPLYTSAEVSARAIPVAFEHVAPPRKPRRRATPDEWAAYRAATRDKRLARSAVAMLEWVRERIDEAGGADKTLLGVFDASYCNRVVFRAKLDRTEIIARARKDARLCGRAHGGRRFYSTTTFTPESVREDRTKRWYRASVFHGGAWRSVRYKQMRGVLWLGGAGRRPVRLLVVAPTPYRRTARGRWMYRQPAYLLTTDVAHSASRLLQAYFDRWQLEVAHREMKDTFGVGQAQVRADESVARQPALMVAAYSAIHVAALLAYGSGRPECLGPLPKWQREKTRPSCLELVRQVRKELVEGPAWPPGLDLVLTAESILAAAAT